MTEFVDSSTATGTLDAGIPPTLATRIVTSKESPAAIVVAFEVTLSKVRSA